MDFTEDPRKAHGGRQERFSNDHLAGMVSARFRAGMLPLAVATGLCVALSAPLADLLLERHDLLLRARDHVAAIAQKLSEQESHSQHPSIEATLTKPGSEGIARIEVLDVTGKSFVQINPNYSKLGWPLVWSEEFAYTRGSATRKVRVAMGNREGLLRDLFLLAVFGALGIFLGLCLYFFPLRLFREEDLVRLFVRRSMQSAESERLRLSRDLHDGIGQSLSAAAVAVVRLTGRTGPTLEAAEMARLLDNALDELRRVSLGLRPPLLVELGLGSAIRALAAEVAGTSFNHTLDIRGLSELTPEVEETCYRLVQEALTNIVRHSGARNFHIVLSQEKENVIVVVRDDGRGFSPASQLGLGLVGARERAADVSGTFRVESAPGHGTYIEAVLPSGVRA